MKRIIASLLITSACLSNSFALAAANRATQPSIFLTCIPKSGTHLLRKLLGMIGRFDISLPGSLIEPIIRITRTQGGLLTHAIYNPETAAILIDNHYKIISLIRDPRDQAVSFIYFAKKNTNAWPALSSLPFDEALSEWIKNTANLYSESWGRFKGPTMQSFKGIDDFYARYLEWGKHPEVYVTRFELLVGEQGGGSREAQMQEIKNIAQFLGVEITPEKFERICNELFGSSRTFRSGQIGGWKTHFKPEHTHLFKEVAGQLLIDLGYETDMNW